MKLNESGLKNKNEWEEKGYLLPKYDRTSVIKRSLEAPQWVHFGAGNIFRAFHANLAERLLNEGKIDCGITVVEGFDYEIVEKEYRPNDNYSILVTLKSDGKIDKTVVGAIAESCILDSENAKEFDRIKEIFKADSLKMATFTITEKGYSLTNAKGEILPDILKDYNEGPNKPSSYMGKVTALLYERFLAGAKPIAMVSTDNCSHNGDKLFAAVEAFATNWSNRKLINSDFLTYIKDKSRVTFPWTMIDKITPRPDASVEEILKGDGLENLNPIVTEKKTFVAPFVNAEETEYLVVEDAFPNGKLPLDEAGVIYTDRETVDKVEKMKVCTCLNPLHTALAIFGCLLGYTKISDEMKDQDLVKLIETIGYKEGLLVVTDPGVINPKTFIDTVISVRLPNPFMPDTPQRIATDTSQKLSVRYGETIKNYIKSGRNLNDLKLIPLVFACWLRYLMGVDDKGCEFSLSPDPLLEEMRPYVQNIELGKTFINHQREALSQILTNEKIFGVNLTECGLSKVVLDYFEELLKGPGAVRNTLRKYVAD